MYRLAKVIDQSAKAAKSIDERLRMKKEGLAPLAYWTLSSRVPQK